MAEPPEAVVNGRFGRRSGFAAVPVVVALRHQAEDANTADATPLPEFTRFRMTLVRVVAEIFRHRRILLS